MSTFDLQELRTIMQESAGVESGAEPGADITDVEFGDLGWDSLAMLELTIRVRREYGVELPDDEMHARTTPRVVIDYVNRHRAGVEA